MNQQHVRMGITAMDAMEVLDSRGNPTVEVLVTLADGHFGRAVAPSGASTGKMEAAELRDHDAQRYGGKGVRRAVDNVLELIAPVLLGMDASQQRDIDARLCELDGTSDKSKLGANALVAVSLACAQAAAHAHGTSVARYIGGIDTHRLPVPLMNVLNGGAHAQNNVDFQEFMLVPLGLQSFAEALRAGSECFHSLRGVLRARTLSTGQGDEGGFAPDLGRNEEAVELLLDAIQKAGYRPGEEVAIALDPATSGLYRDGHYVLQGEERVLTSGEMVELWDSWCDRYPIVLLEDPMAEDDWEGWKQLTAQLGDKVQLIGDDVFVTNPAILTRGIDQGVANGILIKVNQIGTLAETLDTVALARRSGYATVVSHRSGETEDTTIADLAVAINANAIKTGAPSRSERVAKYNQLLRLERNLGAGATYAGRDAFKV